MTPTSPPPRRDADAEVLHGGNTSGPVLRVGGTVRKQWHRAAPSVVHLLRHLEKHGYEAAPRSYGRSLTGDQLLEYVPGTLADQGPPLTAAELRRLGGLQIADAFVESRLAGQWRATYGMLDGRHDARAILDTLYPELN